MPNQRLVDALRSARDEAFPAKDREQPSAIVAILAAFILGVSVVMAAFVMAAAVAKL